LHKKALKFGPDGQNVFYELGINWAKSKRILVASKLASPMHAVPTTPGLYWTIWRLLSHKKQKDPDADVSTGEVISGWHGIKINHICYDNHD
jgi:hypothetical protein